LVDIDAAQITGKFLKFQVWRCIEVYCRISPFKVITRIKARMRFSELFLYPRNPVSLD
jgi:hypothetical protein